MTSRNDFARHPGAARIAGARDALTAMLVEEAGFDGIWVSSLELSAMKGYPDLGLLTMTECLQHAAEIARVVDIPTLVDCDTGYGGAINLRRTVLDFEAQRIAGISVEDKVFPKRNSFLNGSQQLQEPRVFAHMLEVAARARQSRDFILVARVESLIAGESVDEAVERGHLYVEAGADAVLIHSKAPFPREISAFLAKWERYRPVIVVPTTFNTWHIDEAAAAGVSMVIYANHTLRASISASRSVLESIIADGRTAPIERDISTVDDIFELTRPGAWEDSQ